MLALLLGAPAASAHGGPIVLEVVGDGSHGVNVVATWKKDRHPVRDIVIGTVVATSTDSRSFGPLQLVSAPEGQNLYRIAQPLPTGTWRVTVTTTEPAETQKTVNVVARDITAAPESQQATGAPTGPADMTLTIVVAVGIAAAAVIGVAAGMHLLRGKRPGSTEPR
ncbi:hypothetical protein ACFU6I_31410 [Streptomyces sp. NPDC057486]|uniref:hypothetical protein n=1 Tax=Streptomyces sp. NPDC057486 TaxID=3346145 RepID=UPI003682808A